MEARAVSTDDNHRQEDNREANVALLSGVLAAVIVILFTAMALMALAPVGDDVSAISAALG